MWSNPFVVLLFPHPDPNFHLLPSARRRAAHCWANSFRSNQRLHFTVCVTKRLWNVLEVPARDSCSVYFPATLLAFLRQDRPKQEIKSAQHPIHFKIQYNALTFYLNFLKITSLPVTTNNQSLLSFAIITNTNMAKHETPSILKILSFFCASCTP